MPQSLVYLLLLLALLLPIVGAVALRVVAPRISQRAGIGVASAMFGLAILSVLTLGRSNVGSLQLGELTVLLPVTSPSSPPQLISPVAAPSEPVPVLTAPAVATARPTARATASVVVTSSATVPATSSATALASPEPTEVPPTPTELPEPTEAPPTQQTYVVQAGDTLRSIAEQFNVSVEDLLAANELSPEDADALRPDQELVIP